MNMANIIVGHSSSLFPHKRATGDSCCPRCTLFPNPQNLISNIHIVGYIIFYWTENRFYLKDFQPREGGGLGYIILGHVKCNYSCTLFSCAMVYNLVHIIELISTSKALGIIMWVHTIYQPTTLNFKGPRFKIQHSYWIANTV